MRDVPLRRISESVSFEWPWAAPTGLAIISGAAGGSGGGGAFCMEGLNLFGAGGGGGGGGGAATTLYAGEERYRAAGGNGGDGGSGGSLDDGRPVKGKNGKGCQYGHGGDGGAGAIAPKAEGRVVANGGNGGKGFVGETLNVELQGLSKGDEMRVEVGQGGGGGGGGKGYGEGCAGAIGADGFVVFLPLYCDTGPELCWT